MNFSTLIFIWVFLPIVLIGYYIIRCVCKGNLIKNYWLLICSLFFYAWGEGRYIIILLCVIGISFFGGRCIYRTKKAWLKNLVLSLTIVVLLLCLGYYKYFNDIRLIFLHESGSVHLPIGISFFTFQAISFLLDVYRGEVDISGLRIGSYALYISFFPQLIAGPIIKYKDIEEQIRCRAENIEMLSEGIHFFIIGLFRKVIIANNVALVVDSIYGLSDSDVTCLFSWIAAIFYTLQIYFDFSGYSLMAIGLGKMFGFSIVQNFNKPYLSKSISEFWRRWHISLGSWFRDYLYIPLGGNKKGEIRTYVNLALVFLVTGIWHGSGYTFLLWGCFYAFWIVLERIVRNSKKLSRITSSIPMFFKYMYSILIVVFGWVIFRAESLHRLKIMIVRMVMPFSNITSHYSLLELVNHKQFVMLLIAIVWIFVIERKDIKIKNRLLGLCFDTGALLWCLIALTGEAYNPFIYFRF